MAENQHNFCQPGKEALDQNALNSQVQIGIEGPGHCGVSGSIHRLDW